MGGMLTESRKKHLNILLKSTKTSLFLVLRRRINRLPVRGTTDIDNVDGKSFGPVHCISVKQAKAAVILLRAFTEQSSNVDDKIKCTLL